MFILPLSLALGFYLDNLMVFLWVIYVLFPILDYVFSHDNENPDPELAKALEKDWRFTFPLYISLIFETITYFYSLYLVSFDPRYSSNIGSFLMLAFVTGTN